MEYGVTLPLSGPNANAEAVRAVATKAEALGFKSIWVGDHIAIPVRSESRYPYSSDGRMTWDVESPWLDPFLTLTLASAVTDRVMLGTSVHIVPMRPTLIVAKNVATLDWLSEGRAILGVGAGWLAEEFALLGQSFHDRGKRLGEAVQVLRACWSDGTVEFHGRFHDYPEFGFEPKPVQGAKLPILIGGHSDAALRRVVEVGDGWQPTNLTPGDVRKGLQEIKRLARTASRTVDELRIVARPGSNKPFNRDIASAYEEAGADELIIEVDYRRLSLVDALAGVAELAETVGLVGRS